ncbi:unnamed protein product [Meganyctiphanes norvegica]|uniref:C3H1-type domain-containing protein n=1 Tax=Meganyctiphanes norvegica TaxID=48144 RepID=A0AAV2RGB4_MEGNR
MRAPSQRTETQYNEREQNRGRICKYVLRGECNYGDTCRYKHKIEECLYFKEGKCSFGEDCINIHRANRQAVQNRPAQKEEKSDNQNVGFIMKQFADHQQQFMKQFADQQQKIVDQIQRLR